MIYNRYRFGISTTLQQRFSTLLLVTKVLIIFNPIYGLDRVWGYWQLQPLEIHQYLSTVIYTQYWIWCIFQISLYAIIILILFFQCQPLKVFQYSLIIKPLTVKRHKPYTQFYKNIFGISHLLVVSHTSLTQHTPTHNHRPRFTFTLSLQIDRLFIQVIVIQCGPNMMHSSCWFWFSSWYHLLHYRANMYCLCQIFGVGLIILQ